MLEIITYKLRIKAYNTYTRIQVVEVYKDDVRISQKATKDLKETTDNILIDRCIREGTSTTKQLKRQITIQNKLNELNNEQ